MKISSVVTNIAFLLVQANAKSFYNILAIDGGGIRGIIPGTVLEEMEKYAFKYAKSKG